MDKEKYSLVFMGLYAFSSLSGVSVDVSASEASGRSVQEFQVVVMSEDESIKEAENGELQAVLQQPVIEEKKPVVRTPEEIDWYDKFLKGTMLADGWTEITKIILAKTDPKEREARRISMKELGEKIGWEWAKDNDIRKIDTAMLKKWGALLKKTADKNPAKLKEVIVDLHKEVDAILK